MSSELNKTDGRIYLTEFDRDCLTALVARMFQSGVDCEDLTELEEILTSACIVKGSYSKHQNISLYSTVRLRDMDFNREYLYTLVLPLQTNLKERKVSVLAPLGRGMLGRGVGDVFDVDAPAGFRTFRVEEIHQLEDEETSDRTA
jgi:regulator of nucleoside diphosphate kinase